MVFMRMSKRGTILARIVSIFIIQAFIISSITPTAFAAKDIQPKVVDHQELTTNPEKVVIPREFGLVKSKFVGGNNKLVIHIQDAHCNYEAQTNIAKIVETLVKNYNLTLVSVEGADGIIDTTWFKAFPDDEVRKEVANYFMKKGEITGPEFLSITTNYPIKLFGAETREYYIENLNAFTSSYPLKERTEKYYNQIKTILNRLKGFIYSEDLKELDSKIQDYESKKIQFNDYVRFLEAMAARYKVNLRQYDNFFKLISVLIYEKKIDFNIVDKERSALIDELSKSIDKDTLNELVTKSLSFKAGKISSAEFYEYLKALAIKNGVDFQKTYPNLYNYVIYNSVYSRIENEKLFKDIKEIEIALKEKLFANDDQRTLDRLSRHIDILLGLINIKLLNGDYEYYLNHKDQFTYEVFADFIRQKTVQFGLAYDTDSPDEAIKESVTKLQDFYSIAIKRDNALVNNTIDEMKREKLQLAVLVTGGFHSEGIAKLLEKQGISYMVVCPNITKDVPTPYIQILTNQRTPFEEILMGGAEKKEGMLSPFPVSEIIALRDDEIRNLFSNLVDKHKVPQGLVEDIISRKDNVKDAWVNLSVARWLTRMLKVAKDRAYAKSMETMKNAYLHALRASLLKARAAKAGKSVEALTPAEISEVDTLVANIKANSGLVETFERIYRDVAVKQGIIPGAESEGSVPSMVAVPLAEAYSSPEKFISREAADIEEMYRVLMAETNGNVDLHKMALEYRAMPENTDQEKDAKKAKAKEIDRIIRVLFNAKKINETVGFDVSVALMTAGEAGIYTDMPTAEEFKKQNPAAYEECLAKAKGLILEGAIVPTELLAGAATRLFGTGQKVDSSLSYAKHDIYDVAQSHGITRQELETRGAKFGRSMLTRMIIQEWIRIENFIRLAHPDWEELQVIAERRKITWNTPRVVLINDESGPNILREWVENRFYGYNPELVVFVNQSTYKGFDIDAKGNAVLVEDSKPTPAGHGDATMQIVQTGRAFKLNAQGAKTVISRNAIGYIQTMTHDRAQFYVETRVNDMIKLGYAYQADPGITQEEIDLDNLALSIYLFENKGINATLEQVRGDPQGRISVSNPMLLNSKKFSVEGVAQTDDVAKIVTKAGAPVNRFNVTLTKKGFGILRNTGLPICYRFRDGYFYGETVTSDLTQVMNAEYIMDRKSGGRILTDYKSPETMRDMGLTATLNQDNNPVFNARIDELAGLREPPSMTAAKDIGMIETNLRAAVNGDKAAYDMIAHMPQEEVMVYFESKVKETSAAMPPEIFGFGTGYDIRGEALPNTRSPVNLTPEALYVLGKALGTHYASAGEKGLVTGDIRHHTPILRYALALGAASVGVTVEFSTDTFTTGAHNFISTQNPHNYKFVAQLSGSHNPKEGNGVKIKADLGNGILEPVYGPRLANPKMVTNDSGQVVVGLYENIKNGDFRVVSKPATVSEKKGLLAEAIQVMSTTLPTVNSDQLVVIDTRAGAAGPMLRGILASRDFETIDMDKLTADLAAQGVSNQDMQARLEAKLLATIGDLWEKGRHKIAVLLNATPDADMGRGIWDPSKPEALVPTQNLVKALNNAVANGALKGKNIPLAIGTVFDCDVDRITAILESGKDIPAFEMTLPYYQRFLLDQRNQRAIVRLVNEAKAKGVAMPPIKIACDVRANNKLLGLIDRVNATLLAKTGVRDVLAPVDIETGYPPQLDFVQVRIRELDELVDKLPDLKADAGFMEDFTNLKKTFFTAEASGHNFFHISSRYPNRVCDCAISGFVTLLNILETVGQNEARADVIKEMGFAIEPGKERYTLTELFSTFPHAYSSPEIRIPVSTGELKLVATEKIGEWMRSLGPRLKPSPVGAAREQGRYLLQPATEGLITVAGYKMQLTTGQTALVRYSNTGRYLTLMFEARNWKELHEVMNEVLGQLANLKQAGMEGMDLSVLETETAKMAEVAKAEPQAQEVAATEPVQTEVEDEDEPENEGSQGGAVPGVEPAAGETFEPPSRVDRERAASGETEEPPSMTAIDVTTLTIEDAKRDFEATQQEIYARHDASQKDGIVLLFTADDLYETGEARTLVTAMSNKFTLQVAADKSVPYAHVRGKAADAPAVIQSALVEAEKRGLNVRKIVTRLSAATTRDVLDSVTPALERLGNKQVTLKVDMRGKKPAETLYHMVKIEDLSLRIGYELGAEPIGRALHEITNLPMPQCIALAEDIIRFAKKIIELKPIARADLEADISNVHRAARTALTSL